MTPHPVRRPAWALPFVLTFWAVAVLVVSGTLQPRAAAQFQLQDPTAGDPGPEEVTEDDEDAFEDEDEDDGDDNEDDPEPSQDAAAPVPEVEPPASDGAQAEPSDDAEAPVDPEIGTTTRFQLEEPGRQDEESSRFLFPPVLVEDVDGVATTAVFPLFYQRSTEESEELMIPPFYRQRSPELNADVLFPIYWSFRGLEEDTLVIPPFYFSEGESSSAYGLPPLFFHSHDEASEFTIIPPLLTAQWADEHESMTIAGPFWRHREETDVDWGVFPFLWVFEREYDTSVIAPPFYFRLEDADEETALTVIPPLYFSESSEHSSWGIAPLFHHYRDADSSSITIPPALFHYGENEEGFTLVTPLFGYDEDADSSTLVTPLYQNHRGETQFDSVAPFFFWSRNPKQQSQNLFVPPLFWHFEDPSSTTTVAFPFYANFHETGRYTTWLTPLVGHYESHEEDAAGTWIFPNIQISHTPTSNTFNLHPLFYNTSGDTGRHTVLPPLFWDFEDYEDGSRTTVGFPLFWRFEDEDSVTQLAANTFYRNFKREGVSGWEFHFFPLFAFGKDNPESHWWTILYGLAGYQRQGSYARAQALWIPFDVDGPE